MLPCLHRTVPHNITMSMMTGFNEVLLEAVPASYDVMNHDCVEILQVYLMSVAELANIAPCFHMPLCILRILSCDGPCSVGSLQQ